MIRTFFIALTAAAVLLSQSAVAAGDPVRGKAKSAACAACHNVDGNSQMPIYPRLAGQNADYLVHALSSYQNGRRKNEIMKGMAAALSAQDIQDLAAYFSAQNGLIAKR
ncbi:cytochrome c [Uliginosibacterium sp. sgz301328]|uniref:c-type cytochrome n=1 Tax=Uliginosibacterium sp. sgz301328 TaxID=3243764 RepID=UPI00359E0F78